MPAGARVDRQAGRDPASAARGAPARVPEGCGEDKRTDAVVTGGERVDRSGTQGLRKFFGFEKFRPSQGSVTRRCLRAGTR